MMRKTVNIISLTLLAGAMTVSLSQAKVSQEEANKLGKELTPVGAEMAGNAEGTIPAWTGGWKEAPEGVTAPDNTKGEIYPDPFANEKPRLVLTAQNYKDYADKLTDGHIKMFEKYSDFRMLIYPTHRTVAVPERVYEQTKLNAVNAELTEDKMGFTGAKGGYPFPIPQDGYEAIQNHLTAYTCDYYKIIADSYTVYPSGPVLMARVTGHNTYPFHRVGTEGADEKIKMFVEYTAPARRKGELVMFYDPYNWSDGSRKVWQYLTGQRRVRRAPNLAYDTPDPSTSNLGTYDDNFMFLGKIDRYNWKLLGKQEKFIRYNNYKLDHLDYNEYLTPNYINPVHERYELHRVWVVEATLKEDSRHIYGKRIFYIDEDSWIVGHTDKYDNRGELWRSNSGDIYTFYGQKSVLPRHWYYQDYTQEHYATQNICTDQYPCYWMNMAELVPEKYFTIEHLRRKGRR